MENNIIKIIFIGTPKFGAVILEGLVKGNYKPVLVVTATDKPAGREKNITPPPVKITAQECNIPVEQTDEIKDLKIKIENLKPDLIITAAFGQILSKEILDIPKYGSLNIHASLLPKYRGPSPIQAVILNNEQKTGVTIILMDEKIDHGPIIAQRKLELGGRETAGELHDRLAQMSSRFILEIIPKWTKKMLKIKEQDHGQASFTKILTKQDGEINWEKPAEALEREIRAFNPWPGSYTSWEHHGMIKKIKILQAKTFSVSGNIHYPVGKVLVVSRGEMAVQCGSVFTKKEGEFLIIERLQIEGKKEMDTKDFIMGFTGFLGTILK